MSKNDIQHRAVKFEHRLVHEGFMQYVKRYETAPSVEELADILDLDPRTVRSGIKSMNFDPIEHPLRVLTPDIILSIADSAKRGSVQAQKLWLQIFEGFSEEGGLVNSSQREDQTDKVVKEILKEQGKLIEAPDEDELALMREFGIIEEEEYVPKQISL